MKSYFVKINRLFFASILLLGTMSIWSLSFADLWGYTIDDYQTTIELNKEWELLVKEEIEVNFSESRHGIYREIPYRYEWNNWKTVKTKIYDVQIDGYQFKTSTEGSNFKIRIWSPDKYVNGRQYYTIHYKVYWGIRSFGKWADAYQELYWNMLGTQWNIPINSFKFSFILPTEIVLQNNEYYAISGKYWEKNPVMISKQGKTITMQTAMDLQAHEGVTLAVKLPADYVQLDWKKDFPWWYLIFLVPLGVWIYLFRMWQQYGNDEELRDIIYYTPPKWYTPWQIASIYKKNPSSISIFATIYSWATDWYIKIKHEKWTWWFDKDTFSIEKIKEKQNMLTFEELLWSDFFATSNSFSFGKENQSKTRYNKLKNIWESSYNSVKKKLFTPKSLRWKERIKRTSTILLIAILVIGGKGWDIIFQNQIGIASFISFILIGIFVFIFAKYIDKLSPEWKELYEHVLGYKKYLEAVEKPKLQQLIKDDPQYFEKVLPYAVALGMETEWIAKCEKALADSNYQPHWIYGSAFVAGSYGSIWDSINNSIAGFGSASAFSAPSSSWGSWGGGYSWGGWWWGGGGSW